MNAETIGQSSCVKITRITAMQVNKETWIRIDTDAGLTGYGPSGESGPVTRDILASLETGRHAALSLIGQDPLAIQVHFHNLFYRVPQRGRYVRVFSGIDMALWDLAGLILNQPVSKLLGGNFRDEIPLYSHCGGDVFDPAAWRDRAQELVQDPRGFRAFKVDVHHPLGITMQVGTPTITPGDARKIRRAYQLAREAFGPEIDIIVHCHNELDLPSAIKVAEAVEEIQPLYFEDPIAPLYSDTWLALRRTTRLPIMTGENIELAEAALPFLQNQAVDCLQPDLINSGGISGVKVLADLAALYHIPISLHNVRGLALNLASQQLAAAVFNCPMIEARRTADVAPEAASNAPVIRNGRMRVHTRPGLGFNLDHEYMQAHRDLDEPWWGPANHP
jgi:galactonate dehydratase